MKKLVITDLPDLKPGDKLYRLYKGDCTPYMFAGLHPMHYYRFLYFMAVPGHKLGEVNMFYFPKHDNEIWLLQEDEYDTQVVKDLLLYQLDRRKESIKKLYGKKK